MDLNIVRKVDDALERTRPSYPSPEEVPFRPFCSTFGNDYVLPSHRLKLLSKLNNIQGENTIDFLEDPHIYVFNKKYIASASVSGLIKPYVEAFDAQEIIGKMKRSRREAWPRLKYAAGAKQLGDIENATADQNVLIVKKGKTIFADKMHNLSSSFIEVDGECQIFVYDRAMTDDEIVESWSSPEARNKGTEAHLTIENFYNGEVVYETPELQEMFKFARIEMKDVEAYGTEVEIYAPDEDVAGSIDFVGKRSDGTFVIYDWKRSEKLATTCRSMFNKKMKYPFAHIDDCDIARYTFQLSIYKYILEKYYSMNISDLCLVNVFPETNFYTYVPYLQQEVEYLMSQRRILHAKRIAASYYYKDLPRCSISGEVAFDALVDRNGNVYSEKRLLVKNYYSQDEEIEYIICKNSRNACGEALDSLVVERSQEEKNLLSNNKTWAKRMGVTGIQNRSNII